MTQANSKHLNNALSQLSLPANDNDFTTLSEQVINILNADIKIVIKNANLPKPLGDACLYAMTGNGKRVRPLLVACSYYTLLGSQTNSNKVNTDISVNTESPLNYDEQTVRTNYHLNNCTRRAMLAVELLHTYSLIHDDLPCMDDDDLRRGQSTCHIKFDEATAMLAGDVLQTLAFEVLSANNNDFESVTPMQSDALLKVLSPRARRMVIGQMLDLNAENKLINQTQLEAIHRDKTGALIEASVLMGALSATEFKNNNLTKLNTDNNLDALQKFATNIGLAFQVQDDILDVTGSTDDLGKPVGSDEALNKSTYVKLMGVEDAQYYAKSLFIDATEALEHHFGAHTPLKALADWLWQRKK